jgi:hypothetical protein
LVFEAKNFTTFDLSFDHDDALLPCHLRPLGSILMAVPLGCLSQVRVDFDGRTVRLFKPGSGCFCYENTLVVEALGEVFWRIEVVS